MSQDPSPVQTADGTNFPADLRCHEITKPELDSNLNDFLQPYISNGTAANYGVLIVEALPESRPRPLGRYRISRTGSWPVLTMTSTPKIEGLFVLKERDLEISDTTWPQQVEAASKTPAAAAIELPQFLEILQSGAPLGSQIQNLPAIYGGVNIRAPLKIKMFPTSGRTSILRAVSPIGTRDMLGGYFITISTAGAATCLQKSVAQLTTVLYHHRGAPRLWLVVPPMDSEMLERRIREVFKSQLGEAYEKGCCSQFVGHLGLWITPKLLRGWGLRFTQVVLREKQMMLVFPGSYYWGMSTGFSIVEAKAVPGPKWTLDEYRFCKGNYPLCKPKVVFTIEQKAIDEAIAIEATKKTKRTRQKTQARNANREEKDDSASPPSSPGGSGYDADESFIGLPDADYVLSANSNDNGIDGGDGNDNGTNDNNGNDNDSTNHPSLPQTNPLPFPITISQEALMVQISYLQSRATRYDTVLQQHRAYHRILEEQLGKREPDLTLWRQAAMKAAGLLEERDARIKELEQELEFERSFGRRRVNDMEGGAGGGLRGLLRHEEVESGGAAGAAGAEVMEGMEGIEEDMEIEEETWM